MMIVTVSAGLELYLQLYCHSAFPTIYNLQTCMYKLFCCDVECSGPVKETTEVVFSSKCSTEKNVLSSATHSLLQEENLCKHLKVNLHLLRNCIYKNEECKVSSYWLI